MVSWDIDGQCDIASMTDAINFHLRRHDTYHSAFDVSAHTVSRRTVKDPDYIEFISTPMGFMDADQIRQLVRTSTPDTLDWDCFTFGVIQKADHFTVYANVDHLHTDGTSAALIYRDIHLTYKSTVDGTLNPLAPRNSSYRDFSASQSRHIESMNRDSQPVREWVDFARTAEGNWPSFPLPLGEAPTDNSGAILTVDLLDGAQTTAFNAACRSAGARFSGGVMACAALADNRFTGNATFHGLTPSDTRVGHAQELSAGWYASLFPFSVDVGEDFAQMARSAQKSFDANKHLSATPFQRVMDLATGEELSGDPASRPMMFSLMDFRELIGADASELGIYLDNLSHGGVNAWVIRHRDRTTITISFPESSVAHRSVDVYVAELGSAFTKVADREMGAVQHSGDSGSFPPLGRSRSKHVRITSTSHQRAVTSESFGASA